MKITGKFIPILLFWLFQVFFTSFANSQWSNNSILFSLPDRDVGVWEFNRFLEKQNNEYSQDNFDAFMQSFIDYHLKLAQGRQQKLDRTIEFVNELTDYRVFLAKPYLTHPEKKKYYIQKAYERLQFELNVEHILIKMDKESILNDDTLHFYEKAVTIRNQYLDSIDSENQKHSDRLKSEYTFHDLGYFTAFQSEYKFENVAYQLKHGEISIPVRTELGYHIIRVTDKKPVENLPPLHLLDDKIFESIEKANDERIQSIKNAFTEHLKEYWSFTENPQTISRYKQQIVHHGIKRDSLLPLPFNQFDTLCSIDGKFLSMKDFWRFMNDVREDDESGILYKPIENQIDYFYAQFVSHRSFLYENYMLDRKYPKFRNQLAEYRDAMLLLATTQENVWNISSDQSEITHNEPMEMWVENLRKNIIVKMNTEAIEQLKQEWISTK